MTKEWYLKRINNLCVNSIRNLDSIYLAELTCNFNPLLVLNLILRGLNIDEQRLITQYINNKHIKWKRDTNPKSEPALYHKIIKEVNLSIACGVMIKHEDIDQFLSDAGNNTITDVKKSETTAALEARIKDLVEENEKLKEQTEQQPSVDDTSGKMRVELAKAHNRIKELERQLKKTEALKAENERLQNDLEAFKTRDGKVRMTSSQAAIFVQTVCNHLGGLPNDKKKLAPILESLWGYTHYTAEKALGGEARQDVANETASIFEETSPKLARLIKEFPNEFDKLRKEKLKANNDNKVKKD